MRTQLNTADVDERTTFTWVLQVVLLIAVGGSIGWTLQSNQHITMQFLSFAATFIVLAIIFWPFSKPLRE